MVENSLFTTDTSSFEAILMHKMMQILTVTVKVATEQVERQVWRSYLTSVKYLTLQQQLDILLTASNFYEMTYNVKS